MRKLCSTGLLFLLSSMAISCDTPKGKAVQTPEQETIVGLPKKESSSIRDYDASEHEIDLNKYLKNDDLLSYAAASPKIARIEKLKTPFDTLQFNKVIAYDYDGSEEPYGSIIVDGKFVPVVLKAAIL